MLGTPPFRFYHLTAEMNSAYGNSALRFELTCHLARPPEGGFAGFVPFGRSPFGDCACSERMNRPCAEILLRKTFETPDFRRKTPHPRRLRGTTETLPTEENTVHTCFDGRKCDGNEKEDHHPPLFLPLLYAGHREDHVGGRRRGLRHQLAGFSL